MSAQVYTTPHGINTRIAWALDRATDTEVRRAAIALLVEIEATSPIAARALDRIDSTDPLGLMLRREARQAYWGDAASEILPETAEARRIAQRLAAMNAPQITRDRWSGFWRYAAKVGLLLTVLSGAALIASSLWADTVARLDATLAQARCGDTCILMMEN